MSGAESAAPAVLLCGHGTRDAAGVAQFEAFAAAMQRRHPDRLIAHAYLELSRPDFATAIARLYADGVRDIWAVPVLLFTAGHIKRDIPSELNRVQDRHDGLRISMGRPLGLTPAVLETATRLVTRVVGTDAPSDTILLVVGRGTSDPDANGDAAKLARIVGERLGFGFATVGYVAVAHPSVAEALALVEQLAFPLVVVLPLVLFDGRLHKGIARELAAFRLASAKDWRLTEPFCTDTAWLTTLEERIDEIANGSPAMNCQSCTCRLAADHHHHHDHAHDGAGPA